jgi:2-keto-3-deoxy-6-phosphogluconate aldolase
MNSREHIKNDLLERKISAIIRTENQQVAEQAMQAAVDGGFRVVEFTLTTPGALNLITQFRENNDLIVGAGTVMSSASHKKRLVLEHSSWFHQSAT